MDNSNKNDKLNTESMGFDQYLERPGNKPQGGFIGGAQFDATLDEMLFNRMIKLKDLRKKPQGNDIGKIYWDGDNSKFKLWHSKSVGWVDVIYTSTSTTSTSSSSSSTSTTSSSTSTSTTL